jgi:hypothetical protein
VTRHEESTLAPELGHPYRPATAKQHKHCDLDLAHIDKRIYRPDIGCILFHTPANQQGIYLRTGLEFLVILCACIKPEVLEPEALSPEADLRLRPSMHTDNTDREKSSGQAANAVQYVTL